jgi:hypothetical protein
MKMWNKLTAIARTRAGKLVAILAVGLAVTSNARAAGPTYDFTAFSGLFTGLDVALIAAGVAVATVGITVYGFKRSIAWTLGIFRSFTGR